MAVFSQYDLKKTVFSLALFISCIVYEPALFTVINIYMVSLAGNSQILQGSGTRPFQSATNFNRRQFRTVYRNRKLNAVRPPAGSIAISVRVRLLPYLMKLCSQLLLNLR